MSIQRLAFLAGAIMLAASGPGSGQSAPGPNTPAPRSERWWLKQFWASRNEAAKSEASVCFVGDSLTEHWPATGAESWSGRLGGWKKLNLGIAADRVEHMRFRVRGTTLNAKALRAVAVMAGTNNLSKDPPDSPSAVADAVKMLALALRAKCPRAALVILGLPPNGTDTASALNKAIQEFNAMIEKTASAQGWHFIATTQVVADETRSWKPGMTTDGTHLTARGYAMLAEALSAVLKKGIAP